MIDSHYIFCQNSVNKIDFNFVPKRVYLNKGPHVHMIAYRE